MRRRKVNHLNMTLDQEMVPDSKFDVLEIGFAIADLKARVHKHSGDEPKYLYLSPQLYKALLAHCRSVAGEEKILKIDKYLDLTVVSLDNAPSPDYMLITLKEIPT